LAEPGEEHWYDLELKLLADIAIVGFPNAGKSTLISRISAAKPRIADYPFTTLEPHLGVVKVPSGQSGEYDDFVIADIPGIIPGAAQGRGLGLKFLRHIERASILLVLIDMSDTAESSPADQLDAILFELEQYNPYLLERPRLVAGSRMDMAGSSVAADSRIEMTISSVVGQGIDQMLFRLHSMLKEVRSSAAASTTASVTAAVSDTASAAAASLASANHVVIHRPMPDGIMISRDPDGVLTVSGRNVLRAVALTGFDDMDTAMYVSRKLDKLGVDKALKKVGARDGDLVRIGEMEFTYYEEGSVAVASSSASARRRQPGE
jgi:GTP-binding protein